MTPPETSFWFSRQSKPVIFLILTLALLGGYLAFTIPISVFPTTNFPRILIAVDNGVMPIDQMMVTITRPVEEAVNSVPGLQQVRSITSRGSAEIDLFFDWNVDMFQTLQYVNAAISRVQPEIPPTATVVANRMTFASFPIIGYSLTSSTRHYAAHKPDRFARTFGTQSSVSAWADQRPGAHTRTNRQYGGEKHTGGNPSSHRGRCLSRAGREAGLHNRDSKRKACSPAQYQPPAG